MDHLDGENIMQCGLKGHDCCIRSFGDVIWRIADQFLVDFVTFDDSFVAKDLSSVQPKKA